MTVKRPRKPRHMWAPQAWFTVAWQGTLALAGMTAWNVFVLSPIRNAGSNAPLNPLPRVSAILLPYLILQMAGLVPIVLHSRRLLRRLRETDCHLCHDCGYDLRNHTDATPCPECGRVWNRAADTEVWRTLYKGHLKY